MKFFQVAILVTLVGTAAAAPVRKYLFSFHQHAHHHKADQVAPEAALQKRCGFMGVRCWFSRDAKPAPEPQKVCGFSGKLPCW